jgi:hypothetical protein
MRFLFVRSEVSPRASSPRHLTMPQLPPAQSGITSQLQGLPPRKQSPMPGVHDKTPPAHAGGVSRCKASMRQVFVRWGSDETRFHDALVGIGSVARPRRVALVGHLGGASITRSLRRGAAGSRTRVPRSRYSGLYVRRSWIISDTVLQGQTASVSIPPQVFPGRSTVQVPGLSLVDDDPTPLRGLRGGSRRLFRPPWPVRPLR